MGRSRRALIILAALIMWLVAPGVARAEGGYPGACREPDGVSVVVDFTALGGDVITRCAPDAGGQSGLAALRDAGFEITGVPDWGDSFVCRIDGRPGVDQRLTVGGRAGYRETCTNTPPEAAHWSSWYAEAGGAWQFSQLGADRRTVAPGSTEGWSFALNAAPAPPGADPDQGSDASPAEPRETPGSPIATLVGVIALAAVACAAVVIMMRRRRR
ncbi:hypothetical protein [Naumannella huperziae]